MIQNYFRRSVIKVSLPPSPISLNAFEARSVDKKPLFFHMISLRLLIHLEEQQWYELPSVE